MKAVQINNYGGVEVLEINGNVQTPNSSSDRILIEVYAAGINPIDWKVRAGYLRDLVPLTFPATLGGDFSGVVVWSGGDAVDFKVGDNVYGQGGLLNGGSGAFAESLAAETSKIAKMPKNLDFLSAASLPLAVVSAVQALEDHIKLGKDQKILIHGGAGGIGHIAVQLAKSKGANVATTVSSRDMDFAKSLGADEVIDYKREVFENLLKGFDSVFDTVGGEITNRSFQVLKAGGIIVSMAQKPDGELAKKYKVRAIGQQTEGTPQRLNRLAELVDNGLIKVHIDKVFALDQVKEAFAHLEKGHARGKVVLKIK